MAALRPRRHFVSLAVLLLGACAIAQEYYAIDACPGNAGVIEGAFCQAATDRAGIRCCEQTANVCHGPVCSNYDQPGVDGRSAT